MTASVFDRPPNTRVQRTRSSPSAHRSPLTRCPLGGKSVSPALSPFKEADAKDFARAARRSRTLHRGWVHPPTETSAAATLSRRRQGPSDVAFLVRNCETWEIAGYIEVTHIVRGLFQSGYIGFYVFKGFERQGYMTWGLGAIVQRAWNTLRLHRLEANIQPGNVASIALVRSVGFQKEGYSRRYLKIGGRWRDHERWAILAP